MTGKNVRVNLICLVIIITIFSQITTIDTFFRPAMYASWVLLLAVGFFTNNFRIRFSSALKQYIILFAIYVMYCATCSLLGNNHLQSGYMSLLPIPLVIMMVANLFGKDFDDYSITKIAKVYTIAVLIFAIWIHYTYFASYSNWLSFSGGYLFYTKNSAAQTISPAIYMIFFIINSENKESEKKKHIFWYAIVGYLVILLGLCQARTSLLGLAVSLLVYALRYSKKKIQWVAGVLVLAFIAIQIPTVQIFVEKVFNIQKYAGADLNTISSGRVNQYANAVKAFIDSPIIGKGKWYVDCSYLSILTESGVIGFLIIEPIWISKISYNHRGYWYNREIIGESKRNFIVLITVFYIVESLLEAYPPFGPGVTSFSFWFFCEMIMYYGMNTGDSKKMNALENV